MTTYIANPTPMRTLPDGRIVSQSGDAAMVGDKPARIVTASEIVDNPKHYLRAPLASILARLASGEIAAIVTADINGRPAQITLTSAQYALGAPERARHAAWIAEGDASRNAQRKAEREYDRLYNEGGEGYNPHRIGAAQTYAANRNGDREYPDNA